MAEWKKYERFVAALMSDEHASNEVTVVPNAKLIGCLSGVVRQIDVLIDAKWVDDRARRIIVDAKQYAAKIDVKDVETFEGMMRDCQAQYGILVCPNGYSPAAKRRAQDTITIRLVELSELDDFTLSEFEPCVGSCTANDKKQAQKGLVLYDSPYGLSVGNAPVSIVAVGKCDVCGNFHVWCWECGQKFALRNEDEYKCSCDGRYWLTSIEDDIDSPSGGDPGKSVNLFLVLDYGVVISVDRRKLM